MKLQVDVLPQDFSSLFPFKLKYRKILFTMTSSPCSRIPQQTHWMWNIFLDERRYNNSILFSSRSVPRVVCAEINKHLLLAWNFSTDLSTDETLLLPAAFP